MITQNLVIKGYSVLCSVHSMKNVVRSIARVSVPRPRSQFVEAYTLDAFKDPVSLLSLWKEEVGEYLIQVEAICVLQNLTRKLHRHSVHKGTRNIVNHIVVSFPTDNKVEPKTHFTRNHDDTLI